MTKIGERIALLESAPRATIDEVTTLVEGWSRTYLLVRPRRRDSSTSELAKLHVT